MSPFVRGVFSALFVSVFLAGCSQKDSTESASDTQSPAVTVPLVDQKTTGRWYSDEQAATGLKIYAMFCASCHGPTGAATSDWKTPNADGNYPPPPLDGSAHSWHHSLAILDKVITDGGAPIGGVMPAWGNVLNADQRLQVIAGFQSFWPDEVYRVWIERERTNR